MTTTIKSPTVAAITVHPTGGGIARVSELVWRIVDDGWGSASQLLTMFDNDSHPATFAEKARFTASLSSGQVLGRTDWILFTHLALAKIQRAVPERARRRYAVFLHGIEAWNGLTVREKDVLVAAELRLANSFYTAQRVMRAHPEIGQVVACPLAIPSLPTDSRRAVSSEIGPRAVLAVGRMDSAERYKGHDQLIDAWPMVIHRVPDARLIIVGGGDDVTRLREKARNSGAAKSITFTGFVSTQELDNLYSAAAIFALPSRGEGFGLVYLEAMAHRLACIGSIHDAAAEVIVDGETGRLVDQDAPESLPTAISDLLLDEEKRRHMGEAGCARLNAEFSFARFRERFLSLVQEENATPVSLSA